MFLEGLETSKWSSQQCLHVFPLKSLKASSFSTKPPFIDVFLFLNHMLPLKQINSLSLEISELLANFEHLSCCEGRPWRSLSDVFCFPSSVLLVICSHNLLYYTYITGKHMTGNHGNLVFDRGNKSIVWWCLRSHFRQAGDYCRRTRVKLYNIATPEEDRT